MPPTPTTPTPEPEHSMRILKDELLLLAATRAHDVEYTGLIDLCESIEQQVEIDNEASISRFIDEASLDEASLSRFIDEVRQERLSSLSSASLSCSREVASQDELLGNVVNVRNDTAASGAEARWSWYQWFVGEEVGCCGGGFDGLNLAERHTEEESVFGGGGGQDDVRPRLVLQ